MKKLAVVLALAGLTAGFALITPALAGGNAQACLDNYTQCLKGCDGAAQCSNQCKTNYEKCLG
jgi:hypothetical protein